MEANQTYSEVEIIDYQSIHREDFKRLNHEWIIQHFVLEENDHKALNHPEEAILAKGGLIKMAIWQREVVGTCALLKVGDTVYELAKMAVTDRAKGKHIGYQLALEMMKAAQALKATKLELITNTNLIPAISLYHKVGFVEVALGTAAGYYQRGNMKMELQLTV